MSLYTINIRDRRQATLPAGLLKRLDVEVGDKLVFEKTKGDKIVVKPQKNIVMESSRVIRKALRKSGISKKEWVESGEEIRKELGEGE